MRSHNEQVNYKALASDRINFRALTKNFNIRILDENEKNARVMESIIELIGESLKNYRQTQHPVELGVMKEYLNTIKYLIESCEVDVNFRCSNHSSQKGFTPLLMAALLGSSEVMLDLKEKGADIGAVNFHNQTILHCALSSFNPVAVLCAIELIKETLPEQQVAIYNKKNSNYDTALSQACYWVGYNENILDLMLVTSMHHETTLSHARNKALTLDNNQAVRVIDDHKNLIHCNINDASSTLKKFIQLEKIFEIEATIYDMSNFEKQYVNEKIACYKKDFMDHVAQLDQSQKDQLFFNVLGVCAKLIEIHVALDVDKDTSRKLISNIVDVVKEVFDDVSNKKMTDSLGYGISVLHITAYSGNCEALSYFLDRTKKDDDRDDVDFINRGNKANSPALFFTILADDEKAAEILLKRGANPVIDNITCDNPLHRCITHGYSKVLNVMLDQEYDDDVFNHHNIREGNTALHYAITKSQEIFDRLLDKGANPKLCNFFGYNVLHSAVNHNAKEFILSLISHGHSDMINAINEKDHNTALHYALVKNNADISNYLVDLGANPTIKDKTGRNALHLAVKFNLEDVALKLLDGAFKDSLINDQDTKGNTALHYAIEGKLGRIANALITNGASKRIMNKAGQYAVGLKNAAAMTLQQNDEDKSDSYQNAQKDLKRIIGCDKRGLDNHSKKLNISNIDNAGELLMNACLENDQIKDQGWTLLHLAARAGKANVVNKILQKECDINARTDNGLSVLDCAILGTEKEVVKAIAGHFNVDADSIRTSIIHAVNTKNPEILSELLSHKNFALKISERSNKEINDFYANALNKIANPKSDNGKKIKKILGEFKGEIDIFKEEEKNFKKTEKKKSQRERELMGDEDEIRKRDAQRRKEKSERSLMEEEELQTKDFNIRSREICLMQAEDIRQEDQVEERSDISSITTSSASSQDLKSSSTLSATAQTFIPKEQMFLASINDYLQHADKNDLESFKRLPQELLNSIKTLLVHGYDVEITGSSVNRDSRLDKRIAGDVDLKFVKNIKNMNNDDIYSIFQHHFNAKVDDVTIYRNKKTDEIDTVQYQDASRKMDVTLYDVDSPSKDHWIDSIERRLIFKNNHEIGLSCELDFVRGFSKYMASHNLPITPDIKENKTMLFHNDAKDFVLLSHFRKAIYNAYQAVDLVAVTNQNTGKSISSSMFDDIVKRHKTQIPDNLKEKTTQYIEKFMTTHNMDSNLRIKFLESLNSSINDVRNGDYVTLIVEAIAEMQPARKISARDMHPLLDLESKHR